jgi:hypothetical protein
MFTAITHQQVRARTREDSKVVINIVTVVLKNIFTSFLL